MLPADESVALGRLIVYPGAVAGAYINEVELRQIRAMSRRLALVNPFAIAANRNRVAYTVGKGHTYKVSAIDPDDADEDLLSEVRDVIDDFTRENKWPKRQKETVTRLDRDGERFLRFFEDSAAGTLKVRFVEPLLIQTPPGKTVGDDVFFGIKFADGDAETPEEYYLVDVDLSGNPTGIRETIPADEIQHLKANVDMNSPRGLPTWYALRSHLERAMRLLRNITTVAEVQSAIAAVRKHVNATTETIQKYVNSAATGQVNNSDGTTTNYKRFAPGTILDMPNTVDMEFPQAGLDVQKYVAGIQAELRAVAAALGMPEYMISADASNANYSSTMVAEGPAVKSFEEMQADLIEADLIVIRKAVQVAADAGKLPSDVLELVKIEAEPPIIKSENRLQEVQADGVLVDKGAMSLDTFAARHGLEYESESEKIEDEADSRLKYNQPPIMPEMVPGNAPANDGGEGGNEGSGEESQSTNGGGSSKSGESSSSGSK
jgi:hypothetical protein